MRATNLKWAIQKALNEAEQKDSQYNLYIIEKQRALLVLNNRKAEIYQQMAVIFLRESPDVSDMNSIQSLLNQLKQEQQALEFRLEKLKHHISENQSQQEQLKNKKKALEIQRNSLLSADKSFVQLLAELRNAQQKCKNAERLYHQLQQEFNEKLSEYEQEPRYQYLVKRQFGEAGYRGKWIFRNLDSWLARQVNFIKNRKNQLMLLALLDESAKRFENSRAYFNKLYMQHNVKVSAVEEKIGFPQINQRIRALISELNKYQSDSHHIIKELRENRAGNGRRFINISERLADIMKRLPISKLDRLVLQTVSPEDERLLAELVRLKATIIAHEESLIQLQLDYENHQRKFNDISHVFSIFERSNMGNSQYEYNISSSVLQRLLNGVIIGQIHPQKMIDELLMKQRRVHRDNTSGARSFDNSLSSLRSLPSSGSSWASSSSTRSSSGSRKSSGFSTSSSSGGGGFRTTDSF